VTWQMVQSRILTRSDLAEGERLPLAICLQVPAATILVRKRMIARPPELLVQAVDDEQLLNSCANWPVHRRKAPSFILSARRRHGRKGRQSECLRTASRLNALAWTNPLTHPVVPMVIFPRRLLHPPCRTPQRNYPPLPLHSRLPHL
jgi:hypothetical protein